MLLKKKIKRHEVKHEEEINQNAIKVDYNFKEIEENIKSELEKLKAYFKNKTNSKDYKLLIFIFLNK